MRDYYINYQCIINVLSSYDHRIIIVSSYDHVICFSVAKQPILKLKNSLYNPSSYRTHPPWETVVYITISVIYVKKSVSPRGLRFNCYIPKWAMVRWA